MVAALLEIGILQHCEGGWLQHSGLGSPKAGRWFSKDCARRPSSE